MYTVRFTTKPHQARTLNADCVGEHNGWLIQAEIHEDYYEWVNEFEAKKIGTDNWVKGDFELEVAASSKEAYEEFCSLFPYEEWDYWDI